MTGNFPRHRLTCQFEMLPGLSNIPWSLKSVRFVYILSGRGTPASRPLKAAATTGETRINVDQEIEHENSDHPIPTIFKVPKHIREVNPKAYDPVVAPIGPFHHCKYCWSYVMQLDGEGHKPEPASCGHFDRAYPYSISAMQKYKWWCVWYLLSRGGGDRERVNQLFEKFLVELKKKNDEVRRCYSEELPRWIDDLKLASIMLLDGCFIIYLLLRCSGEKVVVARKGIRYTFETAEGNVVLDINEMSRQLGLGLSIHTRAIDDLLKLENQIPFIVIEFLFDQLKLPKDGDLVQLALGLFRFTDLREYHPGFRDKEGKYLSPGEYHHLLHLFHSSRVRSKKTLPICSSICRPERIPGAMKLARAGLKFTRGSSWRDGNFLDITFNWKERNFIPWPCQLFFWSGWMRIPRLHIDDAAASLFQNLIAFEQCCPCTKSQKCITAYAIFMNCIIDQAEDARLLRFKNILEHKMGNDQAVADFFNQLDSQIYLYWEDDYLERHIFEINRFYDFQCGESLVELRQNYLRSPWTKISVLAAIFLLLLTLEQAVFSALSYFSSS